jgi:hypothetical protein
MTAGSQETVAMSTRWRANSRQEMRRGPVAFAVVTNNAADVPQAEHGSYAEGH